MSIDTLPSSLRAELFAFAARLPGASDRSDIYLFRDMLVPPFDEGRIRVVFAMLRMALAVLADDERAALYAPVNRERNDSGFELHADLYLTTRLWLVFDDVPDDGTGASLFVHRRDVLRAIRAIKTIPDETARTVADLMTKPIARDSFGRMYGFLNSNRHPWHEPLQDALKSRMAAIALRRGEGYLINDRRWLHGRTPVTGDVRAKRFHRLTYELPATAAG